MRISTTNKLSFSVVAGKYSGSLPQSDTGPYTQVELGFLNRDLPDENMKSGTIYKNIPIEVIERIIKNNGGYSSVKTLESLNE